ncbi:MAG: hypothetical protein RR494_13855 [Vagococcus sp.]|uniref:hypothetical protein n=1 Tax=Vagococcus TaxID=2737 RepID=UPI002FC5FD5E
MSIKELSFLDSSKTTQSFLSTLKANNLTDLNDYLLFDLDNQMKQELLQQLDFLADDSLWNKEDLAAYQTVAKTIDNDWILCNDVTVLVIPSHLYKNDSEIFTLSIWDFFIQFEEKKLETHILALN